MTEIDGLRDWIGARGLPPADENVVAYAVQLQKLYGGDAHVTMAAALCTADPKGALAALGDKAAPMARAPLSEEQIAALKHILLRLSRPDSRPDDPIETAIVRDAVLLAELRRPLLDLESIRAIGERLEGLHCPASRQQAARDYALSRMLAERTHPPPELEALALRGYYIVLEGIDGTGKNLQADRLMARLRAVGREVIYHEEPTPRLRKLQVAFGAPSPTVELFLYTADRIEATGKVVRPALEQGKDVVSVRCFMSTMAYQSEHYSPADIALLSREVPMPSLILLLDVPPEMGLERVARRRQPATKYERIEQLTRARERYHEAASLFPQAVIIDAAPPVDAVADSIWEAVRSRLVF
jgi:dTMP kinase